MDDIKVSEISSGRDTFLVGERDTYISSTVLTRTEAATAAIKSLHQLRSPVADFVGREAEIESLVQAFSKATNSGMGAIVGIRGLNGIGKTQLAYAVSQRLVDTFPDGQLLLELRGAGSNPLTPEQALQTIIRAFEPLAYLPDSLDALQSVYLTLLNGKRVLILADDAQDAIQVVPLLPPLGCALLLTSNQRFALPGMETLDLNVLSLAEAEKLLLKIWPAIGPAAARMAQLCGGLPLALRMCASICANSTMSIEYHLKTLEDERARLAYMRDRNDPNMSVEASLQLSYTSLAPQEQQVLCQLSVFPTSFDMSAARAVVQAPVSEDQDQGTNATHQPLHLEGVIDRLYRQSLLEWDWETQHYTLHNLVRVFALGRVEDEYALRIRYAQYYAIIATQVAKLYMRGKEDLLDGLKLFDEERTNIDTGWNWARTQASSMSKDIDELLLDYAGASIYVGDLRYDIRRERIPQFEAAVEAARRLGSHTVESAALGNLGNAYRNLGDIDKAIKYYEQGLEIARQIGYRLGEGNALGNLGNAYRNLGEIHKAIEYYERCLEITRDIGARWEEGRALGNLGIAYRNLGEVHKAIEYYEQRLEIARQIGDRWSEGIALGNMGLAYSDLGEPRKAIQFHEQRLEIAREIGDRRGKAIASWNLGWLLAEEGDLARAVELMQVMVDYEREIGHTNAEKDAATVEELRKRLA